ncbi:uncharacterized protein LOC127288324 [Leptopilina boulardi]|uniref:uncharacterized protein LOC127288324 n=1 Tax=Leptopilina boulardi TaxID=63433 RepID=UPI0021F527E5|nr:uncharacterized protein LOC127288324 [Leptopilina boulardi]
MFLDDHEYSHHSTTNKMKITLIFALAFFAIATVSSVNSTNEVEGKLHPSDEQIATHDDLVRMKEFIGMRNRRRYPFMQPYIATGGNGRRRRKYQPLNTEEIDKSETSKLNINNIEITNN